ncbi:39329_t:CDS:2, partial [Gigaspora margarita]
AWMRSNIWENWLCYIDSIFRSQERKILLIVDNAPSHISLNSTDSEGVSSTNALTNNDMNNTTIKNCWNSTGILLNITNSDELEPEQFFIDEDDYDTIDFTDNRDPIVTELISDLKLYYKIVDKPVTTEDIINDNEILAMVHRTFDPKPIATDSKEDKVPPAPSVNLSEAINILQLLIQFQEQRESDDGFKPEDKKQTDLFHYFGDTENLIE